LLNARLEKHKQGQLLAMFVLFIQGAILVAELIIASLNHE
jgi:hypothetical protein